MLNVDAFSEDSFVKSELRGDIRLKLASPEIRYSAGFNQDLCLFSHSFLAQCRFYAFLSSCFARGSVRRWWIVEEEDFNIMMRGERKP